MCRATISAESIAGVCASCPLYHMKNGCCIDLIACPQCGYHSLPQEHPGSGTGGNGATRETTHAGGAPPLTARADGSRPSVGTADASAPPPAVAACSGAMRLSDVPPGTKARLLGFSGIDSNHLGRLTAYGLLPGVNIEMLQRFPAIILGVYQAELALETKLAEGIWVLAS
jgi:Fe2+ transport system protein FeoA